MARGGAIMLTMRVILQLLKEFWLPLLLGIGWTAFNVIDKPSTGWTVREVLNIFGPTFFFMSWLVAQWYRVRKQQRVEEGLTEIHAGVRAIQAPLLPCSLFVTLELTVKDDDVKRVFGQQAGFQAYGPDRPMPPPPFGLPPGMRDARLHRLGGYLDYRNGVVEAAGMFRHTHPGFNVIHREVKYTVCTLETEALSEASSRNDPIFATPSAQIEFFFKGRPSSKDAEPSLILKGSMTTVELIAAYAMDNHVFVDLAAPSLSPIPVAGSSWSTGDLKGAFIRVTLDFFYIEGVSHLPREGWPILHNLQLWFGANARQLLTFSIEQLRNQTTRENPKPIAMGKAVCPQIVFEYEMDATAFVSSFLAA